MRAFFKKILFATLYYLGITSLFYYINKDKQRILVFHHIISDEDINQSFEQQVVCTSKSKFRWMMEIVNKRFLITTEIGAKNTAVITFDDGYRAIWNAYDVLRNYNNQAIVFLPLSAVDGGPLWIDCIMAWFAYVPDGIYNIDGEEILLNTQESRKKAFSKCIDSLYIPDYYNPKLTLGTLDKIYPIENLKIPERYYSYRFKGLSLDEIANLKSKGYKFGAHSIQHDILSCLSHDKLYNDFHECEHFIGNLFNTTVYAYPFGHKRDVTKEVMETCNKSGFDFALMNEYVPNESQEQLSRLNISHYSTRYEIEAALSGLTQWIKNL